jgi:hypothetical protein
MGEEERPEGGNVKLEGEDLRAEEGESERGKKVRSVRWRNRCGE